MVKIGLEDSKQALKTVVSNKYIRNKQLISLQMTKILFSRLEIPTMLKL